jgi:hypothetical protein
VDDTHGREKLDAFFWYRHSDPGTVQSAASNRHMLSCGLADALLKIRKDPLEGGSRVATIQRLLAGLQLL